MKHNKWRYAKPFRVNLSMCKVLALCVAAVLVLHPWSGPLALGDSARRDILLLNPNGDRVLTKQADVERGQEQLAAAIALEAPEGCPVVEITTFQELLEFSRQVAVGAYDAPLLDSGVLDSGVPRAERQQDSGPQTGGAAPVFARLAADINLNELDSGGGPLALQWLSIGTEEHPFSGIFDGGGHTISGLDVNIKGGGTLFGHLRGATLANLKVAASPVYALNGEGLPPSLLYHRAERPTIVNCVSAEPEVSRDYANLTYLNSESPDVSWFYDELDETRAESLEDFLAGTEGPVTDSGGAAPRMGARADAPPVDRAAGADTGWFDTSKSQYVLETAAQIAGIAVLVGEGNSMPGKTIVIAKDIDFEGMELEPIGRLERHNESGETGINDALSFRGRLVGWKGYSQAGDGLFPRNRSPIKPDENIPPVTLSNFKISSTAYASGFVGHLSGGVVENLIFQDCEVNGADRVGMVVGFNGMGLVNRCAVYGGTVNGSASVGGLVGHVAFEDGDPGNEIQPLPIMGPDGTAGDFMYVQTHKRSWGVLLYRCSSTATVTGATGVGGIAGVLDLPGYDNGVAECMFSGMVTGETNVGGIVGNCSNSNERTKIFRCASSGSVTGADRVGGILGSSSTGYANHAVNDNYSNAIVDGYSNVGGIVGAATAGHVRRNYFSGTIPSGVAVPGGSIQPIIGSGSGVNKTGNYACNSVIQVESSTGGWKDKGYANQTSGVVVPFANGPDPDNPTDGAEKGSALNARPLVWIEADLDNYANHNMVTRGNHPRLRAFQESSGSFASLWNSFSNLSTVANMSIPSELAMFKPAVMEHPEPGQSYVFYDPAATAPGSDPDEFVYVVPTGITGWGYYDAATGAEILSFDETDYAADGSYFSGRRPLPDPTLAGGLNHFTTRMTPATPGSRARIYITWAQPFWQDTTFLIKTHTVSEGFNLSYAVTVKDGALRLQEDAEHMPEALLPGRTPGAGKAEMGLNETTLYFHFPEAIDDGTTGTSPAPAVRVEHRERGSGAWSNLGSGSAACSVQRDITLRVQLPAKPVSGWEYRFTLTVYDLAGNKFEQTYTGATPLDTPPSLSFDPEAYGAYETGEAYLNTATLGDDPTHVAELRATPVSGPGWERVEYQKVQLDRGDPTYAQYYSQGVVVTDDRALNLAPTDKDGDALIHIYYIERKEGSAPVDITNLDEHCGQFRVVYRAQDLGGQYSNYIVRDYLVTDPPQIRVKLTQAQMPGVDQAPAPGVGQELDIHTMGLNMTDDDVLKTAFTMHELVANQGKSKEQALALALTAAMEERYTDPAARGYVFWYTGSSNNVHWLYPMVDQSEDSFRQFVMEDGKLTRTTYTLYKDPAHTRPLTDPYPGDGPGAWEYVNVPFSSNSGRTRSVSDLFSIAAAETIVVMEQKDFVSVEDLRQRIAPKVSYLQTNPDTGNKEIRYLPASYYDESWSGTIDPNSQATQRLTWKAGDILGLGFDLERSFSVIVSDTDMDVEIKDPNQGDEKETGDLSQQDKDFWEDTARLLHAAGRQDVVEVAVPYGLRYAPVWVMEALAEREDVTLVMKLWDSVTVSLHSSHVDLSRRPESRTVYDLTIQAMNNLWINRDMLGVGVHLQQFHVAAKGGPGSRYYDELTVTLPLDDQLKEAPRLVLYRYDAATHRYTSLGEIPPEARNAGDWSGKTSGVTVTLPNAAGSEYVIAEPLPDILMR